MDKYELLNEELKRLHETLRLILQQDIYAPNTLADLRLCIHKIIIELE